MADDTILLKRSGVPGEIPLPSQLALGELALNYADARLFTKKSNGVVTDINAMPPANNIIYVSVEGDDANDGRDPGSAKRTIRAALNAIEKSNTVAIGPGTFIEKTPLILPQNVTLHGVDQRITTVKAEDPTKDIIWVSSACYVTGFAIKEQMYPSAAISYPGNVEYGTAQSAGSNTIVLDASVAVTGVGMDNYYREMRIQITSGTGTGQSRNIVSYAVDTLTANVDVNWTVVPDSTSVYLIDIRIPTAPSPNTRYSAYTTASPYLYNLASLTADKAIGSGTTSITIAYGSISLTIETGLTVGIGRRVRIKHDPNNFMVGNVVSYNSGTGVLVVDVIKYQRQDNNPRTYWDVLYVCGDGIVVDGYHAAGLKSMVSAQFTQFNQGGRGVVIRNMGYAQLVSIYGICCEDAFVAESGGTASMGNCNVNFGNRGLVANGVSEVLLTANAGFTYNETKCRRDTGLIVDTLAVDILMGSNTQSVFAGIQYWNQDTIGSIPTTQLVPTIGTFEYLQTLANNVVRGDTTGTRYQAVVSQTTTNPATTTESLIVETDFQYIIDILNNGTTGVTDQIIPNGVVATVNANKIKAYNLLQSNKSYLQKEATAFIGATYPDSIRQISSAPTITGTGPFYVTYTYTSMNAAPTVGSTYTIEGNATTAYNGDFAVVNSSITTANLQYTSNPGTWGSGTTYLTSYNRATCERDVGYIIDCLSFDLKYTGNRQAIQAGVYYYGYTDVSAVGPEIPQTIDAYNKVKQLAAYVISNTAVPLTYQVANNQVFSTIYGTSNESNYANNLITLITDIIQDGPTVAPPLRPIGLTANAAMNTANAASILISNRAFIQDEVISYLNTVYGSDNQTGFTINVSTVTANTDPKINIIANTKPYLGLVMYIEDETTLDIQNGQGYAIGDTLNIAHVDATFTDYMTGTITAWDPAAESATVTITSAVGTLGNIHATWETTKVAYDRAKCERDTGLIIDAIAQDLYFTGNTQSTFSGLQYWDQSGLEIPALQVANTIAAIEAARNQALTYIVTVPEQTKVQTEFNLIRNILNGTQPLATITDAIVPNSLIASTSANVLAAKAALQTNLAAIKAAAVAVDPTLSGTTLTKCQRDIGYIVDSICNDLVYGGNRQAIQSGVYYYTYTSTSAVPTEIPQINEAYGHIKELATYIIQGWNIPFKWQTVKTQDSASAGGVGTSALVTEASGLIDLIISIISDRTIGLPNRLPLPLNPSAVAARAYAAKQLYYNRDFIIAEVIGYLDRNYKGRFTQEIVLTNTGTLEISTIDTSLVIPKYRTVLAANTIGDITTLELDERIITALPRGKTVRFYQKSTLSASGQTFEFVGSGTNVTTALPRFGGDIIQESEVVSSNGGIVYFTSTDQFGNFRIGEDLVINFNTGTLSGRTFTKSLYAQITPFVLALSND
jgi:hypothetical protein